MPETERYSLPNDSALTKSFPQIVFVLPYIQRELQIEAPAVSLIKILGANSVSEYLEKLNSGDEVILHHYQQLCRDLDLNYEIHTSAKSALLRKVRALVVSR